MGQVQRTVIIVSPLRPSGPLMIDTWHWQSRPPFSSRNIKRKSVFSENFLRSHFADPCRRLAGQGQPLQHCTLHGVSDNAHSSCYRFTQNRPKTRLSARCRTSNGSHCVPPPDCGASLADPIDHQVGFIPFSCISSFCFSHSPGANLSCTVRCAKIRRQHEVSTEQKEPCSMREDLYREI